MDRKDHWENVYTTKSVREVGWYEADPALSLELIAGAAPARGRVIDVGGGASLLVDKLLDEKFAKVAVLDISSTALARSKERLGARAAAVQWIVGDVTNLAEVGKFDVWHDRAVFHFLTQPGDRRQYATLATRSIPVGGHLIVGTFALDGPAKCSGLDVCRYDAAQLAAEFAPAFVLVSDRRHTHQTPWGKGQAFTFCVLKRLDSQ